MTDGLANNIEAVVVVVEAEDDDEGEVEEEEDFVERRDDFVANGESSSNTDETMLCWIDLEVIDDVVAVLIAAAALCW